MDKKEVQCNAKLCPNYFSVNVFVLAVVFPRQIKTSPIILDKTVLFFKCGPLSFKRMVMFRSWLDYDHSYDHLEYEHLFIIQNINFLYCRLLSLEEIIQI